MNELSIMGNNIIGRMYRPHKMLNSYKRGFLFHIKYRSNFGGGAKELLMEFNLEYNNKQSTEVIKIDIKSEGQLKVAVRGNDFDPINKLTAKEKREDRVIKGVRNLIKPDTYNISKKAIPAKVRKDKGILYLDLYINSDIEGEEDIVQLATYPSVIEGKEYIVVEGKSVTPIVIRCEDGVEVI